MYRRYEDKYDVTKYKENVCKSCRKTGLRKDFMNLHKLYIRTRDIC